MRYCDALIEYWVWADDPINGRALYAEVSELRSYSSQITQIGLEVNVSSIIVQMDLLKLQQVYWPSLKYLELKVHQGHTSVAPQDVIQVQLFAPNLPQLSSLVLSGVYLDWSNTTLSQLEHLGLQHNPPETPRQSLSTVFGSMRSWTNLRSLTLVHYLAPVTEPLDDSMCISLPNLTTLTIADEPGRIAHFLYHLDHSACTAIDLSASATPGTSKTVSAGDMIHMLPLSSYAVKSLHTRATHIIIGFTPRPPFVDATELECGQDTSTVVFPGITAFEYNESALAPTSHPEKILALRPTPAPLLDDLALAQRLFWETVDAATALLTPAHTTSAVRELRVEGPLDALDAHTLSLLLRSLPALHKLQLVHHAPRPAAGTVPARMPPGIASVFDAAAGSCAALRELELRDLPSAGCVPFLTALGAALSARARSARGGGTTRLRRLVVRCAVGPVDAARREAGEHVEEAEGEEDEEEVVAELRDLFAGTAARVALWYGKRGRVVHEDDTDSAVDAMDWESDNLGGNPAVS